jgi:hypothetical protein
MTSVDSTTCPIDAVIYGSTNSNNLIDEDCNKGNVDVADAPASRSIERTSSGWIIQSAPTPNDCSAVQ